MYLAAYLLPTTYMLSTLQSSLIYGIDPIIYFIFLNQYVVLWLLYTIRYPYTTDALYKELCPQHHYTSTIKCIIISIICSAIIFIFRAGSIKDKWMVLRYMFSSWLTIRAEAYMIRSFLELNTIEGLFQTPSQVIEMISRFSETQGDPMGNNKRAIEAMKTVQYYLEDKFDTSL